MPGGFWQCMHRRGKLKVSSLPSWVTVASWINTQLYGVNRSVTYCLSDQSETLTLFGYIFGNGFWGFGNLDSLASPQASTHASHPIHFRISIRVANSFWSAPLAVEGSGSDETPRAPTAAKPPFMNDLREILSVILFPLYFIFLIWQPGFRYNCPHFNPERLPALFAGMRSHKRAGICSKFSDHDTVHIFRTCKRCVSCINSWFLCQSD